MTSPVDPLLTSLETLLTTGSGWLALGLFDPDWIYRGDAPVELPTPHLALCQNGACKERHKQGSGLWEVPVSVRLVLDRNGILGDTPEEIEESIRSYADDMEAILTMNLRLDPDDEEAGFSTPEERMTDESIHVWEIFGVEVEADTETDGDPVCEIKFTAFCAHAALIIPTT